MFRITRFDECGQRVGRIVEVSLGYQYAQGSLRDFRGLAKQEKWVEEGIKLV